MAEASGLALVTVYPDAWVRFLVIFLSTNLLTGLFYAAAKRWKLLPAIRNRDVHSERKPRVGGVAMWLVLVGALVALAGSGVGLLSLGGGGVQVLQGVIGGLIVILVTGLMDDLVGIPAGWQFIGQICAALSVVMGGLRIEYLRLPLIGQISVSPAWSAFFVIFWIVVMINALNLFDGLDGLAGSIGLTGSFVLFLVSLKLGFVGAATLCLVLFGVTAGFLPWNWHPSKLFMGTVGSQLLGYVLAVAAVASGAKVATAVLVLGIPLFDAVSVVVRRVLAHENPFKADQRHLHHRLLHLGLTPPYVVLVTNTIAVTFGILALSTQQPNEKGMLIIVLVASMFLVIAGTHVLERRAHRA